MSKVVFIIGSGAILSRTIRPSRMAKTMLLMPNKTLGCLYHTGSSPRDAALGRPLSPDRILKMPTASSTRMPIISSMKPATTNPLINYFSSGGNYSACGGWFLSGSCGLGRLRRPSPQLPLKLLRKEYPSSYYTFS